MEPIDVAWKMNKLWYSIYNLWYIIDGWLWPDSDLWDDKVEFLSKTKLNKNSFTGQNRILCFPSRKQKPKKKEEKKKKIHIRQRHAERYRGHSSQRH